MHERRGDDSQDGARRLGAAVCETVRHASHGGLEVRAEVAVAALAVEVVEQLPVAREGLGEALDPRPRRSGVQRPGHRGYQVSAGVRTGASQSSVSSSSRRTTVSEQPDMSSDVT